MAGLLELYEGYLNKPTCGSIKNIRIGRDGRGYRKLTDVDIPIEWLHYAKKKGIPIKKKTLIIGEELDPVDVTCAPLLNIFFPQNESGQWCCTPAIAQYTNNGSQTPTKTCFGQSPDSVINIPYVGIALIDANGSLDLLMDDNNVISSATPGWINPASSKPVVQCSYGGNYAQYAGYAYISFAAIPTQSFNIATAYLLIGTNTLASGGVFNTTIEWQSLNYQPTLNIPLTINIYLGVA